MTVLSKKKSQAEEGKSPSNTHGHVLPLSTTQAHSQVQNTLLPHCSLQISEIVFAKLYLLFLTLQLAHSVLLI